MAAPTRIMSDESILKLCDEIIKFLIDNPLTYNWRTKFLVARGLSPNYLYNYVRRTPSLKEKYKMINYVVCENIDNCVQAGTIQYGYATYLYKIFRNEMWNTPRELLEVEKIKTEINNIKSQTALIDTEIKIGWSDDE